MRSATSAETLDGVGSFDAARQPPIAVSLLGVDGGDEVVPHVGDVVECCCLSVSEEDGFDVVEDDPCGEGVRLEPHLENDA